MKKRVQINVPLKGHKAGSVFALEFNGHYPVDPYWRRRFVDAEIEAARAKSLKQLHTPSIEVVKPQPKKQKVSTDAE